MNGLTNVTSQDTAWCPKTPDGKIGVVGSTSLPEKKSGSLHRLQIRYSKILLILVRPLPIGYFTFYYFFFFFLIFNWMDAWSLMRGDAFIHFVSGSRRVNIRLGVLLLIPKSPQADSLAKAAINIPPDKTSKLPYTDLKHKIKQIITKRWQQLWNENAQNKLRQIEPFLKERKREASNTRREETILSQLRIGHTRLTHNFILKEESPPKCPCENHYTIRHILIECTNLSRIQKTFYKVNSMKELFEKINPKT